MIPTNVIALKQTNDLSPQKLPNYIPTKTITESKYVHLRQITTPVHVELETDGSHPLYIIETELKDAPKALNKDIENFSLQLVF